MGALTWSNRERRNKNVCYLCVRDPQAATHMITYMGINGHVCKPCYEHFMSTLRSVQARQFMDMKPVSEN